MNGYFFLGLEQVSFHSLFLINKISCVRNVKYFYFNDEYMEYLSDIISQLHHLNMEK